MGRRVQCSVFSMLLLGSVGVAFCQDTLELSTEPRNLQGVPGEPLQIELAANTARAWQLHLRVPAISNLVLRAVENVPMTRTEKGRFVQKRVILWQGVEAGTATITNLVAEINGETLHFPPVEITVAAVEPAARPSPPPAPPAPEEETE